MEPPKTARLVARPPHLATGQQRWSSAGRPAVAAKKFKFKAFMYASGITAVILVGALAGMVLKEEQQLQQERKKVYTATDEEKIDILLEQRKKYVSAREQLEKKIRELQGDIQRERAERKAQEQAPQVGTDNITVTTLSQTQLQSQQNEKLQVLATRPQEPVLNINDNSNNRSSRRSSWWKPWT